MTTFNSCCIFSHSLLVTIASLQVMTIVTPCLSDDWTCLSVKYPTPEYKSSMSLVNLPKQSRYIISIFSTQLWADWTVVILSIYSPLSYISKRTELWRYYQYVLHSFCISERTELWRYYQYILHSSASLRGLNCGDIINIFSTHLHLWVDWTSQYYQYSLPSSVSLRGQSCGKEAEKTPRGLKFCLVLNKSS